MYTTIEVSVGEGCLCIKSTIVKTNDGISIYIGGGQKPHIGTVVISQPRKSLTGDRVIKCTTSVINTLGHKDDEIAIPIAEEICKKFEVTTVVTAGVHIDDANDLDIKQLKSNSEILMSLMTSAIEEKFYNYYI